MSGAKATVTFAPVGPAPQQHTGNDGKVGIARFPMASQPPQELTAALQRGMYRAKEEWCMLCVSVKKAGNRGSQVPQHATLPHAVRMKKSKVEKNTRSLDQT